MGLHFSAELLCIGAEILPIGSPFDVACLPEPTYVERTGGTTVGIRTYDESGLNLSRAQRIHGLLQRYLLHLLPLLQDPGAVVFLLPSLQHAADQHPGEVEFGILNDLLPAVMTQSHRYIYPYGRTSLLMALPRIEDLLLKVGVPGVTVVSVDCVALEELHAQQCLINNDSLMVAKVNAARKGLVLNWSAAEIQVEGMLAGAAVAHLFGRYIKQALQPIDLFRVPFSSIESITSEWLDAYSLLQGAVTSDTNVRQSNAAVGELGAAAGLFDLMVADISGAQQHRSPQVFALEFGESGYRAAAAYRWE